MYINTIAFATQDAKRHIQELSRNGKTQAEIVAFLREQADTPHTNRLVKVANKMSPNEFYCQDPFKTVVNICHEPLSHQEENSFYKDMFNKCVDNNNVYLMCKSSDSRVCNNEVDKVQYGELSGSDYITSKVGDNCTPMELHSDL